LTADERDLYVDLVEGRLGERVRLEQELIDWLWVEQRLSVAIPRTKDARVNRSKIVRHAGSESEVLAVDRRRVLAKDAVKRAAVRSTKASAKLENRVVPAGFVRSSSVERFLAARQPRP
jgi:ribosomal protein L18E